MKPTDSRDQSAAGCVDFRDFLVKLLAGLATDQEASRYVDLGWIVRDAFGRYGYLLTPEGWKAKER